MMDFSEVYEDTCSTVSKAAKLGNVNALKHLIQSGKPIDIHDNRGWTCIHEAAYHGHLDCLNIIIVEGAEVDCRTFEEETALLLACRRGHTDCVQCLLDAGADPNSATREDYTPLTEAAVMNVNCVKLLVPAGARVNHVLYTGDTALHEAINKHENNYIDVVKYLVSEGADLTIQNECGLTPLFLAAQYGLIECLQYLLDSAVEKGEDYKQKLVNIPANDNCTPLYIAAQEAGDDHVQCVKLLIENGADPNINLSVKDDTYPVQIFPLQIALHKHNLRGVELLAPVTRPDLFTEHDIEDHPVTYAVEQDNEAFLNILLQYHYFDNITFEFNPFTFHIKIRPAIVLLKKYSDKMNKWVQDSADMLKIELPNDSTLLLLCLRHGYRPQGIGDIFIQYYEDMLYRWCALLKYCRYDCYCADRDTNSTPCEASCNPVWQFISNLNPESVVFLQSLLACPVSDGTKHQRKQCSTIKQESHSFYNLSPATSTIGGGLQHMCRQTVVLQLIYNDNYNREVVRKQLNLPKPVQQFLLFEDTPFGEEFVSACEIVARDERRLDELIEEVTVDCTEDSLRAECPK